MKKNFLKLFTALLAVTLIAGLTFFYACKKEEAITSTITPKAWEEKIVYMDLPCVDFSRIKKDGGSKGTTMLQFESWEHYASVIDAMLDFSYDYIATRVQLVRDSIPEISDDDLSLILHNQGIYQFMPLYSFIQQLQFTNSAFQTLRTEEILWMQDPPTTNRNNPFDEMKIGYIQSALHNADGDVMIGNEIYNPYNDFDDGTRGCFQNVEMDLRALSPVGEWPTYFYNGKTREIRGFLTSKEDHSYAKTSVYYFSGNTRIVWLTNVEVKLIGIRLFECSKASKAKCGFKEEGNVYASVCEKYAWYPGTKPNFLHPDYIFYGFMYWSAIVHGHFYAPGAPGWYNLGL